MTKALFTVNGVTDQTLAQALKLEVERDLNPGELINLVENPSGALGTWGWVTPVAGSSMRVETWSGNILVYQSPSPAVASYFYTESLPVAAGQYVMATWRPVYVENFYRARFEFLDANENVLSTGGQTAQTAYLNGVGADVQYTPVLAPAGTAYARLRFDHYGSNTGAVATANSLVEIQNVTVVKANTSAELATTLRTNLVTNPSFEVNTTGWSSKGGCTIARSTTLANVGTASLAVTGAATTAKSPINSYSSTTTTATFSVPAPHYFAPGDTVTVAGTGVAAIDGTRTVTGFTGTSVTVDVSTTSRSTTTATGASLTMATKAAANGPWTVTNKVLTSNTATLTLTVGSTGGVRLRPYDGITISGMGAPFDGSWVVGYATTTSVTFTITGSPANVPSQAATGSVAYNSAGNMVEMIVEGPTITPETGKYYRLRMSSRAGTVARQTQLMRSTPRTDVTGVPATVNNLTSPTGVNSTTAWTDFLLGPVSASANFVPQIKIVAKVGEVHYIDSVMVEQVAQGAAAGTYFDGDTPDPGGTLFYQWTGTAHASASTYVDSNMEYVAPIPYTDQLGSVSEMSIVRSELEPGTLTAVLTNPNLDPAVSGVLKPGRRFRVSAWNPNINIFDPLIMGKLTNAKVDYFPLNRNQDGTGKTARITLTGADAVMQLANTKRANTVGTIAELPAVLEGAGVPWNVNGSGNQIAASTTVLVNEDASALDLVAVARDTELGYAWVDRAGVLQAHKVLPTAVDLVLGETDYNPNVIVDFDTSRAINSVIVRRQWTHATEGPQETVYGPYEDAASVAQWGRLQSEFNVAGTVPASIPAYANSILAANKTPQVLVQSVEIPVMNNAGLADAFVDLYDLVQITNGTLVKQARVTSIKHEIRADREGGKWLVILEFQASGGVAQPTAVPAPPANAVPYDTGWVSGWAVKGGSTPFPDTTATTINRAEYRRVGTTVQIRGQVTGAAWSPANADHANQNVVSGLPTEIRPSFTIEGAGRYGDIPFHFSLTSTGIVTITGGVAGTYAAGTQALFTFTYFVG